MCRVEEVFLAVSVLSPCERDGAGAQEARRAPAWGWISPFSPPHGALPGNEFLLPGDLGLAHIKSGLWALGAGGQT